MSDDGFITTSTTAGIGLDPDFYEAMITGVELDDGKYGPQYKFTLSVDGRTRDDGTPVTVYGWTSRVITQGSKLGKWLTKLDLFPPKGTRFDVRGMIGYRVRLVITADDEGAAALSDIERSRRELVAFTDTGAPVYADGAPAEAVAAGT